MRKTSSKFAQNQVHFLMKKFLKIFLLLLPALVFSQKKYTPDWVSLDSRPTPDWWLDAKFGIFIHWGVYAVPGWCSKGNYGEWYQYGLQTTDTARQAYHRARWGENFSYYEFGKQFKPVLFDPDDWAKTFEKAGARYVVLTSKHHDGYCLWQSPEANAAWGFDWNSVDCAARRDLVGDLFKSLRKTSVQPGLYYSLFEWFNPIWQADKPRFAREVTIPQLNDLVKKYQPKIVWADGDWDLKPEIWKTPEWLAWLYSDSPVRDSVVVNDRWGVGVRFEHAGAYSPEYQPNVDFENHAWEESRGMGFSYGYNRAEDAWDYNSTQVLLLHLVDKVSRGGNFLLDIGPDELGKIPPIMQQRLLEMGDWLRLNGEAIYNTRRWRHPCQWSAGRRDFEMPKNPHFADDWKTGGDVLLKLTVEPDAGYAVKEVFFTYNPTSNDLFALLPKWPDEGVLTLKNMNFPAGTAVSFLENGQPLEWQNRGTAVEIQLPVFHPNRIKSKDVWALKIKDFGKFSAKPKLNLTYDFQTMQPSVKIESAAANAQIFYSLNDSFPDEKSLSFSKNIFPKRGEKVVARVFEKGKLGSAEVEQEVKFFEKLPAAKLPARTKSGLKMWQVAPEKWTCDATLAARRGEAATVEKIEFPTRFATEKGGAVWEGWLKIEETGGYQFFTESDDGSQIFLDNSLIVNNDGLHGEQRREGLAFLEKGWHSFRLVYFNAGGGSGLKFGAARVSGEKIEPLIFKN